MTDPLRRLVGQPWVRCVNFHHTPKASLETLDRQFAALARAFSPVAAADLEQVLETGRWHKDRPGILLAFYNGYRNNYDVAYRLLEKHGLVGWFFVVTGCTDLPPQEQPAFAREHSFNIIEPEYADERLALSWPELHEMGGRHEICSHTASHSIRLDASASPEVLRREIVGSARAIEAAVGRTPPAFCWLLGEPYASSPGSHVYLEEAGYRFLFGSQAIEALPGRRLSNS
jgi:peptidoglycan/xylan/chitin deacetylase (PgdA/CDA1 family)